LQEPFIGVAVEVSTDRPSLRADKVDDELPQQSRLLNLALCLAEYHTEIGALLTQLGKDPPILAFQSGAVQFGETVPGDAESGRQNLFAAQPLLPFVGHLEEQQVAELFDVVDVGDTGVAEDVTVAPQLVDQAAQFSVVRHELRVVGAAADVSAPRRGKPLHFASGWDAG